MVDRMLFFFFFVVVVFVFLFVCFVVAVACVCFMGVGGRRKEIHVGGTFRELFRQDDLLHEITPLNIHAGITEVSSPA